ncbi:hypothetical protein Aperf_G00000012698 [Anoplocephala perfoliata]
MAQLGGRIRDELDLANRPRCNRSGTLNNLSKRSLPALILSGFCVAAAFSNKDAEETVDETQTVENATVSNDNIDAISLFNEICKIVEETKYAVVEVVRRSGVNSDFHCRIQLTTLPDPNPDGPASKNLSSIIEKLQPVHAASLSRACPKSWIQHTFPTSTMRQQHTPENQKVSRSLRGLMSMVDLADLARTPTRVRTASEGDSLVRWASRQHM